MTIHETDVCPTLESAMGGGGGNIPIIMVCGIDSCNQTITEEHEEAQHARCI